METLPTHSILAGPEALFWIIDTRVSGAEGSAQNFGHGIHRCVGAKLAEEIESNEEWKAQPAQREVARGDVLATVREMLAR